VTTMCPGLHSSWGMEFGRRSRPGLNQKKPRSKAPCYNNNSLNNIW
jgi:hypothetical protein